MKRLFDIVFSLWGILFLLPFITVIALLVGLTSKGGVLYLQTRVGIGGRDFKIFKFRTMKVDSDKLGLITVGSKDPRVTKVGYYLRKLKLDELPQLFNVLFGTMSFVGPRPEVRKYTDMYTEEQREVLTVKPGITDYASLKYFNENEVLGRAEDPDKAYINEVMPEKLKLNLKYIEERSLVKDIGIIFRTIFKIFK